VHKPVPREINRENFLRVNALLQDLGAFPFFGTLLGLVREGDILSNDDDVDFYLDRNDARKAIRIMKRNGYKLRSYRGCFMQFKRVVNGVKTYVDFYLYEFDSVRGRLVEKWSFFGTPDDSIYHLHIPQELIFPLVQRQLLGETIMVPAQAEECCAYLYGERWRTPASKSGQQYVVKIQDNRPSIIYEDELEFAVEKHAERSRKTIIDRLVKFRPVTRIRYFLESL
jgi:hypothetical protein